MLQVDVLMHKYGALRCNKLISFVNQFFSIFRIIQIIFMIITHHLHGRKRLFLFRFQAAFSLTPIWNFSKLWKRMIIDLSLGWLGDNGQRRLESVKGSKMEISAVTKKRYDKPSVKSFERVSLGQHAGRCPAARNKQLKKGWKNVGADL